jgi:membrane dipeptidase
VSWALVGDQPWLKIAPGGFAPSGKPIRGQASTWLKDEAGRAKAHLSEQGLPLVRTPADVARSLEGKPQVVLSVEGATFADTDAEQLKVAYDLGIRHVQLVHFLDNPIGDIQTARASHGGLTKYGIGIVEACNRLGILIDVAHCTERTVDQVLEMSKAPVVWSHSSVSGWRALLPFGQPVFARRQLSSGAAARVAAKGGVVGLWALGADVGTTIESYTDRLLDLVDRLGDGHVAFGTDMNALSRPALTTYSDLRRVVDLMLKRGRSDASVRKIAIENYARVLTAAMNGRVD